jgi:hypothetical protein
MQRIAADLIIRKKAKRLKTRKNGVLYRPFFHLRDVITLAFYVGEGYLGN